MLVHNPDKLMVAPMADICMQWQVNGALNLNWYFDKAKAFAAERIVYNSVQIDSPMFSTLKRKTVDLNMAPEFIVDVEAFCEIEDVHQQLKEGVYFTVLIYKPLSPELICKVDDLREFVSQLSFVILARKDWNMENCYRSVPSFMRSRLYVDFPMSVHHGDPFYGLDEIKGVKKKFENDFLNTTLKSYYPNLGLHNEWARHNISHFSQPRKLANRKPKISIIASNPEKLKELCDSQVMKTNPEFFEILVNRVAGVKTKVVPRIKSVTMTKYWAHPVDEELPVNSMILANYSATQADGDVLFFLDFCVSSDWDALLTKLLAPKCNFARLLLEEGQFVFSKERFLDQSGFDSLLVSPEAQRLNWGAKTDSIEWSRYVETGELNFAFNKVPIESDKEILAHRLVDQYDTFLKFDQSEYSNRRIEAQKIKLYSADIFEEGGAAEEGTRLYNSTPLVAICRFFLEILGIASEKSIARRVFRFLGYWGHRLKHWTLQNAWKMNPLRLQHFLKRHLWKLSPMRLRHWANLHLWKYSPVRLKHWANLHLWKYSPVRLRHWANLHLWKYNPVRLKHWLHLHLWKYSPVRLRHWANLHLWKYSPVRLKHWANLHLWKYSPVRLKHWLNLHLWKYSPVRLKHWLNLHLWKYSPVRLKHWLNLHLWKYSPVRLKHWLNLHLWKYSPVRLWHFAKLHLWKVSPMRFWHFGKPHFWKLNPMRLWHFLKLHFWKVSPMRLWHFVKPHFWKLSPLRLWHFLKLHLWKVGPLRLYHLYHFVRPFYFHLKNAFYRLYYQFRLVPYRGVLMLYRASYPFRKIYYFSSYQYEKRVLGLHRRKMTSISTGSES